MQVSPHARECYQVQVYRVQNQLDRHQHNHHVAASEHTDHTQHEQCRCNDEIVKCSYRNHKNALVKNVVSRSSLVVRNSSLDFGIPNDYRRTTNDYIFFFVMITAPRIATSNSSEAISKANVYSPILPASP